MNSKLFCCFFQHDVQHQTVQFHRTFVAQQAEVCDGLVNVFVNDTFVGLYADAFHSQQSCLPCCVLSGIIILGSLCGSLVSCDSFVNLCFIVICGNENIAGLAYAVCKNREFGC